MRTAMIFIPIFAVGCVHTQYYKEVVVTRDGFGNVESVVVTERIIQPKNVAEPMRLEYIQLVPVNAPPSIIPTPTVLPRNEGRDEP